MLTLIVARADNGVIGRDGGLPWRIPADLRHFRRLTVGKPVVMGRRTFESIGKPLPGRHNIIMTRSRDWTAEGVTVVPNLAEAVAAAGLQQGARPDEIMIIGGVTVFAEALPSARRVYLTEVHAAPDGDTVLSAFDPAVWRETAREAHPAEGDAAAYSFVTLDR
nr:dihydrofolate reductase [Polymorphobacter sp.]